MSLSPTYSASKLRIKAGTTPFDPKTYAQNTRVRERVGDEWRYRAPTQEEIAVARSKYYTTRPKLTDYDMAVLALKSDLKKGGYALSDDQLDALMGTGAAMPERQEELTLTLGSRSARRVSPYSSTSSSSLKLGS